MQMTAVGGLFYGFHNKRVGQQSRRACITDKGENYWAFVCVCVGVCGGDALSELWFSELSFYARELQK